MVQRSSHDVLDMSSVEKPGLGFSTLTTSTVSTSHNLVMISPVSPSLWRKHVWMHCTWYVTSSIAITLLLKVKVSHRITYSTNPAWCYKRWYITDNMWFNFCQQSWQGRLMKIRQDALREIARVTLQSVLHHVCIRHTAWVKSLHKAFSSTCVPDQARHTAWVKMVNSCYCFEDAKKKSMGNDYVQFRSISHRSGTCGDWREILSDYLLWFIQFPRKGPAATEVGCYRWYFESWPELLADQNMKCWDSRNVVRDSKFEFEM